jgi:UDP-N-acetylmuramoyl-L-alanyl-D-glutamate--2,6-diaminopimelate ligase
MNNSCQKWLSSLNATGISLDARTIQTGDVFIALPGNCHHGIDFIDQAISQGCVGVLFDQTQWEGSLPYQSIPNLKQILPQLAAYFYPEALKQKIIGITGTNGKTSTAFFIAQLLSNLNKTCQVIGTLNSSLTTPDIFTLYRQLHQSNSDYTVLEVSSHALAQGRVLGLNFVQAILTNLTQDHLDYHLNLENYRDAKAKLFAFKSLKQVIINQDDKAHSHFLASTQADIQLYSLNDFTRISEKTFGFLLQLDNFVFETHLLGRFNLSNLLAAYKSLLSLGFESQTLIPLLSQLSAPPGRMQAIKGALAWVDYAHTPDALTQAILSLKAHYPNHNIRVLLGCGGNRDQNKRAQMGKIASSLSSSVILTNDNPRNEDPDAIIQDIIGGIDDSYPLEIIQDRHLAIETAITTLNEGECLLIAGKGHEDYQLINQEKIPFNDFSIAQSCL